MSKRPRRAKRNKQEEDDGWVVTKWQSKGEPTLQETIDALNVRLHMTFDPGAPARFSLKRYSQRLALAVDLTDHEVRRWLFDNFPKNEVINERRCVFVVEAWIARTLAERALAGGDEAGAWVYAANAREALVRADEDFESRWKGEVNHRRAVKGRSARTKLLHAEQAEAARLIREKCVHMRRITEYLVVRTIQPSFDQFIAAREAKLKATKKTKSKATKNTKRKATPRARPKRDTYTRLSDWVADQATVRAAYLEVYTGAAKLRADRS